MRGSGALLCWLEQTYLSMHQGAEGAETLAAQDTFWLSCIFQSAIQDTQTCCEVS